jgi:ribonucleoside-diphosphate reductase alpha chain
MAQKVMAQKPTRLHPAWHGVRFRRTEAAADPDAPVRVITLPASWDEEAAAALAALAPGEGPVHLAAAAAAWIAPACAALSRWGWAEEDTAALAARCHERLRTRRAAPTPALWRGEAGEAGFVFNLPAFFDPVEGFAAEAFIAAIEDAVVVLSALRPEANRLALAFADLAGLIAALGLDYAEEAARATGTALAALLRLAAEQASAKLAPRLGRALHPATPLPPLSLPRPLPEGLGAPFAAALARLAASRPAEVAHAHLTALLPPGPIEALLGAEAGGFAPAFGLTDGTGRLRRSARALLAARGLETETALALALSGSPPLREATQADIAAMAAALTPWIERSESLIALPPLSLAPAGRQEETRPAAEREEMERQERGPEERARFVPLPARRRGYTQKVLIGGHPLFLRTGEYPDGRLGEIALSAPREAPAVRALLESVAEAVSIGLQHGVPLAAFIEAFRHGRFGPHGVVEGDEHVAQASSFLDYAFRHLAAVYLGTEIPPLAETAGEEERRSAAPLLPLDLPEGPAPRGGRRRLKVVA